MTWSARIEHTPAGLALTFASPLSRLDMAPDVAQHLASLLAREAENQLGRRNLTPESVAYLRGKLYREEKKAHGGDRRSEEIKGQELPVDTAGALAERFKTSPRTIKNDAKFSEQLDELAEDLGGGFRQQVLSRDTQLTRDDVAELASLPSEERPETGQELPSYSSQKHLHIRSTDAVPLGGGDRQNGAADTFLPEITPIGVIGTHPLCCDDDCCLNGDHNQ